MVGAEIRSKFEGLLNTRGDEPNGGNCVVFSLLEGEMSRIWYQNDQQYPNSLNQ